MLARIIVMLAALAAATTLTACDPKPQAPKASAGSDVLTNLRTA